MAYSIYTAYGDGVTTQFTISFGLGYIDKADVKCRVNSEVDGLGEPVYRSLTWITDSLVQVGGTVPANGNLVEFIRTVSKTSLVHDYSDGVEIQEKNLDDSNKQTLMAVQEVLDGRFESGLATDLDFANHKAINVATGTNPTDAVNLEQVADMTGNAPAYAAQAAASADTATTQAGLATTAKDAAEAANAAAQAVAAGMKWRPSVKVGTTANITLSGTQTIDDVAVIVGDRVMVKDQTTPAENGVYVVAAGAWTRATDADTWAELISQVVAIEEGTVNADLIYICTVNASGTLGTTAVTWSGINIPLQDNAVTTNKILDGAVTYIKLAAAAIASVADIVSSTASKVVSADILRAYSSGWTAYTPTFVGLGTVTGIQFWYKREGKDLLVRGVFTVGTPTAVPATITLPSSLTIDFTSMVSSANSIVGNAGRNATGTAQYTVVSNGVTNNLLYLGVTSAVGGNAVANGSSLFNAGNIASIDARVPITGW